VAGPRERNVAFPSSPAPCGRPASDGRTSPQVAARGLEVVRCVWLQPSSGGGTRR
jgi:hypothetical protein